MRIVQINGGAKGSTGKIMMSIADLARTQGHVMMCASPITTTNKEDGADCGYFRIGTFNSRRISVALARTTGYSNCFARFDTLRLLLKIDGFQPDFIHLHNLHDSYINLPLLFHYIKKNRIPTVWTFHDCWAFTGHCPYFDMVDCEKWKTGCFNCPQYRDYPKSVVDNSRYMYKLKKKWFSGIENLTIVTPSQWLAGLVKESFLKNYPVKVINNGIDLNIFKPVHGDFRAKYALSREKHIVLGVALGWGTRKGLDIFIDLAAILDESKYQIVLVGTDEKVDKCLPESIISIHRTQDQTELAEIYTAADVFVNPTREDNYPTVNMEAIACGTPVITFNTGGSPEMLDDTCGVVIEKDNISALEKEIIRVCETKPFSKEACVKKAKKFDMREKYKEYIELYRNMHK